MCCIPLIFLPNYFVSQKPHNLAVRTWELKLNPECLKNVPKSTINTEACKASLLYLC